MNFVYDDGGRKAALYKGTTGDCVCRAVAIASGLDYQDVYAMINFLSSYERPRSKRRRGQRSSARTGVFKATTRKLLAKLGWVWQPTMQIGSGCKVHLRSEELPKGRIIVQLSKHLAAVIDGVLHDLSDCSRDGTRCVYGYWYKPS